MVESEAKGLDEETMLGAVMFGHEQMQVAIKAINELAAEAGKPKWPWVAPEANTELKNAVGSLAEKELAAAYAITEKQQRYAKIARDQERGARGARRRRECQVHRRSSGNRVLQSRVSAGARADPRGTPAHRRPRHQDRAADQRPHRRACAHARLGAVHARRDAGAGGHHARHRARCADHRRPDRRAQRAVHAPLQLPALQRRRDRHDGLAEAARDRSRQPRQARCEGRHAGHREISRTSSAWCPRFSSRTARAPWHRFAARASR